MGCCTPSTSTATAATGKHHHHRVGDDDDDDGAQWMVRVCSVRWGYIERRTRRGELKELFSWQSVHSSE